MRNVHPVVWAVGSIVAVILLALGISAWHNRRVRNDAVVGEKIEGLQHRDSSKIAGFDSVSKKIDSLAAELKAQSGHIDTVIRKVAINVRVPVAGTTDTITRVDSVFKDSVFARLSDSVKVEVLRLLAERQSRTCSVLATTCQQARDSARSVFVVKDSLISLWHVRYDNKPRRRCGVGTTIGIIGGVTSSLSPIAGVGAAVGFTCNL